MSRNFTQAFHFQMYYRKMANYLGQCSDKGHNTADLVIN